MHIPVQQEVIYAVRPVKTKQFYRRKNYLGERGMVADINTSINHLSDYRQHTLRTGHVKQCGKLVLNTSGPLDVVNREPSNSDIFYCRKIIHQRFTFSQKLSSSFFFHNLCMKPFSFILWNNRERKQNIFIYFGSNWQHFVIFVRFKDTKYSFNQCII